MVNIQAKFKKDNAHFDGLAAISEDIVKDPMAPRVIVGVLVCTRINHDVQDGTDTPTLKLTAVEVGTDKDALVITSMLERLYAQRTGRTDHQPTLFEPDDPAAPDEAGDEPWPGDVEASPAAADDESRPASQAEAPKGRRKRGGGDAEQ
jgi:hypothetical protein